MAKRKSPIPNTHPAPFQNAVVNNVVATVVEDDKQIVQRNGGKVTEEEYKNALVEIACGATMDHVTKHLGLSRSALLVRANDDPDGFGRMLRTAQQMGAYAQLEMAESALWKGSFSTGDVQRDKAIAEHLRWKAARLLRDQFGDKALIEAGSFTVIVQQDSDDII